MTNETGVIYQIRNLVNGAKYYGQTKRKFSVRKREHLNALRKSKHENLYLQTAWIQDGEISFTFEILETCLVENLCDREQFFLNNLTKADYNVCKEASKGPDNNGERCGRAKYSNELIIEIKKALSEGAAPVEISKQYEIPVHKIYEIKLLITWKEVGKIYNEKLGKTLSHYSKGSSHYLSKLNEEKVLQIRKLLKEKVKQKEIAKTFNVNKAVIQAINVNRTWKDI